MTMPRRAWNWHDWKQADANVASGEVREHHHLEFKRDNYGNEPKDRKELAKDVAALAIDGGTLVIGVDEDNATGRAITLTPVPLTGQVERIQQICAGRIDPALAVQVDDVVNPADPATGLIVIEVPRSPLAPHQVDGRYVGRADRITRTLTDAEVVRLHQLREPSDDIITRDLSRARETAAGLGFGDAALTLTITPIPARRPDLVRDKLSAGGWQAWLQTMTDAAETRARTLDSASRLAPLVYRDRGFSFSSRNGLPIPGGRSFRYNGSTDCHLALEVFDSGAVTLFARDVTAEYPLFHGSDQHEKVVDHLEAISYTFLGLAVFSALADHAGFQGTAGIGLHLDGLRDAMPPRRSSGGFRSDGVPYRDNSYQRLTSATTIELAGDLTPVMDRLYGRLLRALGLGDPLRPPR